MRILVDARTLGRKPSGIGMYIYRYVHGLAADSEISLTLATDVAQSDEIRRLSKERGVELYTYGKPVGKGLPVWGYTVFLKRLTEKVKPDIFWEPNNLLPVRFHNPYGKYVVTIHDAFPVTMPECYGRVYPAYFRYGVRKTLHCCDAVLYISETACSEIEEQFPDAVGKKHLVGYIIVPPVSQKAAEKKDYFFYVGNLEKRKGTDLLLNAYGNYLDAGGTRELVLAGKVREDAIRRQLDEMAAKTDRMRYLGYIDEEERNRRYGECAAFVFPTRAEGFGIPVIEAMSCGTEVIASDLPVFRELAGDTVRYFRLDGDMKASAARLTAAMLETKESENANEKRKRRAEQYTEECILPRLTDFFRALIGESI